QAIQVASGWENALEAAFRERLNAIAIDDLGVAGDWPETPKQLSVYVRSSMQRTVGDASPRESSDDGPAAEPLVARVEYRDPQVAPLMRHWLHGVRCAESLDVALGLRRELKVGESFVTPHGHLVTPYSVTYFAPDSELHGVLARQREIDALEADVERQR